ncbi:MULTISPECIES: class A beta-lactamase [unclassified Francisella]|uniref:class A beta-lactamase n=1 Tax=unclassified Francisella TaxID=2610885 RepID=UPI002E364CA4|nr:MULTISPECIES: class A beta-lactamase [unclassified Francisella]MED7819274.1 class A beta-lactamase [Francisella sp. 19S2-4]MED7830096.1 class A beta-lactamase [Francisella sp. 19S2-10]
MKLLTSITLLIPTILLANTQTDDSFKSLEKQYNGKLGVYSINTPNKTSFSYNENYHFPICSVFKFLLVGAILEQDMHNKGFLDKKILISEKDVKGLGYTPVTGKNINKSLTISQLCFAAILSDNAAANILVKQIGGIKKVDEFTRKLGDHDTIIRNDEPKVNYTSPDSNINKTTPKAITSDLYKLISGNILDKKHKDIFIQYLQKNYTGKNRIAVGMPKNWIIGDKTGTCGEYGATNDIAIIWPQNAKPFALGMMYTDPTDKKASSNEKIIQQAAKIVANNISN